MRSGCADAIYRRNHDVTTLHYNKKKCEIRDEEFNSTITHDPFVDRWTVLLISAENTH